MSVNKYAPTGKKYYPASYLLAIVYLAITAISIIIMLALSGSLSLMVYCLPALASDVFTPFPRQEIATGVHDGIQVNSTNGNQTIADYKDFLDNSSDIQRITYSSNGKILNATLWLNGPIHATPSNYGANTVVYGVLIDIDNNPTTGKFGVDYQKETQWTNKTASWNSFLVEYSSTENYRVLDFQRNSTGFFLDNQTFALVSIDLNPLTSPTVFRVLYYSILVYNSSKMVLDLSSWIDIPPPQYVFSTTPSPLVVRQGEQKNVGLQLVSSTGTPTKVSSYQPLENYSSVTVEYDQIKVNQSQSGFAPAHFRIKVPLGTPVGQYVVPILTNISTGSIFPSNFVNLGNQTVLVDIQGYHTARANLTISVIEAQTFSEQIKDFWSVYGALISLVGAGFAGGISTYLFDYLKNRKKKS
jgi:hypothetical protein